MNWKFWKRNEEPDFTIETKDVSVPTLARWYLYDTEVASPNAVAKILGLMPTSEEGEKAELEASYNRQARVIPYNAFITMMSDINANAMVAVSNNSGLLGDLEHLSKEDREKMEDVMRDLYGTASYLALFAAFSAALEIGIIANPGILSSREGTFGNE